MKKYITSFYFIFLLIISVQEINGQEIFYAKIQINDLLKSKNFSFSYDDGIKINAVTDTFINNTITFTGKFYSQFAVLKIMYTKDSVLNSEEYFINTKPVFISFSADNDLAIDGNFHAEKVVNASEIHQSSIKKQRNEFGKIELDKMVEFCKKNENHIWRIDSLKKLFYKKLADINHKDIEFIKKNGNKYFSFWQFRTQVLPITFNNDNGNVAEFKNLLDVFNTSFPQEYKETVAGEKIRELLIGRINTQKNQLSPNYKVNDIQGKIIELTSFKGKYVLLDFWATWCPPCMKERPFIKKIRNEYSEEKLVIIGISSDRDYKKFKSVIKEINMNWIHVFGNTDLIEIFGVSGIPATFLINKEGIIIFDGKGEDNDDTLIKLLDEM